MGTSLAHVSHAVLAPAEVEHALDSLLRAALMAVSAADGASVTALDGDGRPYSACFVSDLARDVDEAQYNAGEGPALEVGDVPRWTSVTVVDLAKDPRWPRLARSAHASGVRSILSVSLFTTMTLDPRVEVPRLASLNLYSRAAHAFGDAENHLALLLSLYGATTLAAGSTVEALTRQIENLEHAVETRTVIGRAQGILMERHHLTENEAFEQLRTASMNLNRKLHDVAADVADTGQEPAAGKHTST